ncbi:MAG: hypothetical protein LBR07_06475, partial [Puniceicoccales bacterium]|nr:hypothetical protein [Puniceicoccales bacterium]
MRKHIPFAAFAFAALAPLANFAGTGAVKAAGDENSAGAAAAGATAGSASAAFAPAPDVKPLAYNPMLFGQFIEHFHRQIYGGIFEPGSPLSNADGFRTDVADALRELRVPIVRWPGGCFVSSYHWQDGVGPAAKRVPTLDKAWGVEDPNTFGTVEFVKWCRLIGAEPYICTNAGTGTAEEMSDWVEYCNARVGKFARMRAAHGYPEPLGVKYWSIGNENWGGHELGAKTVEEWGPLVRESAKLMRAVDPTIKLFAAATFHEGWTLPMLRAVGSRLNYIAVHAYYDGLHQRERPAPFLDCMLRTDQPAREIAASLHILDKARLRGRVKIAFDEWNLRGWHHPGFPGGGAGNPRIAERDKNDNNATYTMADALFSACFLNTLLRNAGDVEIGGFAPVVNTRGPLYAHKTGIVKRTTYHVLHLYANRLEKNILPAAFNSPARLSRGRASTALVDAVLTCDNARRRHVIAAVNKSPDAPATLAIPAEFFGKNNIPAKLTATVLDGDSPDAYNDVGNENRV